MNEILLNCVKEKLKYQIEITDKLDFRNDLGFDSYEMMSIVIDIEQHFKIKLNLSELIKVKTLGELDCLINKTKDINSY